MLGFLIDDGCHRLGLLSILLWRSKILMRETAMDATWKGGVKLRLVERRVSMVGKASIFCMMMDCGYAEELSCEKSYPMMYSFLHLSCFQRS